MSEYSELVKLADAAIAECEDAGQRWPTGDDWFSPSHYSAELNFVKAASPLQIKTFISEIEYLRKALTTIREESHDIGACECAADALIYSRK